MNICFTVRGGRFGCKLFSELAVDVACDTGIVGVKRNLFSCFCPFWFLFFYLFFFCLKLSHEHDTKNKNVYHVTATAC